VADANAGNIGEQVFQSAGPWGCIRLEHSITDISAAALLQLASASRIIRASSDLR
jgi:hypothetical protein